MLGLFLEHAHDEGDYPLGDVWDLGIEQAWARVQLLIDQRFGGLCLEWTTTAQHPVQQDTHRVDVRAAVHDFATNLFGRA